MPQPPPDPRTMFEPIHEIFDYYDGPLIGIADCAGERHYFERCFDEDRDQYVDLCMLSPLTPGAAKQLTELHRDKAAILERWVLACMPHYPKWTEALLQGRAPKPGRRREPLLPFPLPQDRARQRQIEEQLGPPRILAPEQTIERVASFDRMDADGEQTWTVRWLPPAL